MTVHSTFNTGSPLAYFLIWTTYGTWLPGDERGWNRKGEREILPPNALFVEMAQSQLKKRIHPLRKVANLGGGDDSAAF
jgi:hypothetical protein